MPRRTYYPNHAALRQAFGQSPNQVRGLIRNGSIKKAARGFYLAVPLEQLADKGKSTKSEAFHNWDDRKKRAEALHKELRLRQLRGSLVTRESVIRCWQKVVVDARQILMALPDALELLSPEGELRKLIRVESTRYISDALRLLEEGGNLPKEAT